MTNQKTVYFCCLDLPGHIIWVKVQSINHSINQSINQSINHRITPRGERYKETIKMNIATCTCTHKEHNKNKVHCVVQVTCHVGRSGHLESGSELRYCDLRRVVFQYDHALPWGCSKELHWPLFLVREGGERQGYMQMHTVQANEGVFVRSLFATTK